MKPGLTEDWILPQIEVAFGEVDFMAAPCRTCARSVTRGQNADAKKKLVKDMPRIVSRALEAMHDALTQRLERVPHVRADGP